MAKPKPWDGVRWFVVCPISGGGWSFVSSHPTREEAERLKVVPCCRVVRCKVRLPREE